MLFFLLLCLFYGNRELTLEEIWEKPAVQRVVKDGLTLAEAAQEEGAPSQPTLSKYMRRLRESEKYRPKLPKIFQRPRLLPNPDRLPLNSQRQYEVQQEFADVIAKYLRPTYNYPVVSTVAAGAFNEVLDETIEPIGNYPSTLQLRSKRTADGQLLSPFALEVKGHAMTNSTLPNHFPDGAQALIDPCAQVNVGSFVAVLDLTDRSLMLRQLVKETGADKLALKPLNSDYSTLAYDDEHYSVSGVVAEVCLRLKRLIAKTN